MIHVLVQWLFCSVSARFQQFTFHLKQVSWTFPVFLRYSNTIHSRETGIVDSPGLNVSGWSRCSFILKQTTARFGLALPKCCNSSHLFAADTFPLPLDQIRTCWAISFTGFNDVEVTALLPVFADFTVPCSFSFFEIQKPHTLQSWDLKASRLKLSFFSLSQRLETISSQYSKESPQIYSVVLQRITHNVTDLKGKQHWTRCTSVHSDSVLVCQTPAKLIVCYHALELAFSCLQQCKLTCWGMFSLFIWFQFLSAKCWCSVSIHTLIDVARIMFAEECFFLSLEHIWMACLQGSHHGGHLN